MKTCSFKHIRICVLVLVISLAASLNPVLSKNHKASQGKGSSKSRMSQKTETYQKTQSPQTVQSGLPYDAQSAVLMDGLTGQILYEQSPQLRTPPASFVKVMTLFLVHDAIRAGQLKLGDLVTVSENAWRRAWKTDSSKMFIKVGERVGVEELMKGVAIASGNDACVALAEHLSGSEETFVVKMNEKAKSIGLRDSQFKNSDGLPADGQYITAMDMAILSRHYIEDHPEALALHSTTEYEYNGIRQGNRNVLLQKNIGVDGLKTGHVEGAGYHLVATAKRDGQRMIAVVMGCNTIKKRAIEAQKLLEYGFKNFSTVEAIKRGASFGPAKVRRGKLEQVTLTAAEDVRVTVPKGKENSISLIPELPEFVSAPIQRGQVVGKVLIKKDGQIIKEVPLLSSSEIGKSLIPPWPVVIVGTLGLAILVMIGVLWTRRSRQKKF